MNYPGNLSGVVGVLAASLHTAHLLIGEIKRIKDVPKLLEEVMEELETVKSILSALSFALDDDEIDDPKLVALINDVRISATIAKCNTLCSKFREKFKKWTKNSTDEHLAWRDQVRLGVVEHVKITEFQQQLVAIKGTISMAMNAITVIQAVKKTPGSALSTNSQLQMVETTAKETSNTLASEISALELALPTYLEAQTTASNQVGALLSDTDKLSLEHNRDYLETLCNYQGICQLVLKCTVAERRNVLVEDVQLDGKALLGIINVPTSRNLQMNVDIRGVRVGPSGRGAIGIIEGVDISELFD